MVSDCLLSSFFAERNGRWGQDGFMGMKKGDMPC